MLSPFVLSVPKRLAKCQPSSSIIRKTNIFFIYFLSLKLRTVSNCSTNWRLSYSFKLIVYADVEFYAARRLINVDPLLDFLCDASGFCHNHGKLLFSRDCSQFSQNSKTLTKTLKPLIINKICNMVTRTENWTQRFYSNSLRLITF